MSKRRQVTINVPDENYVMVTLLHIIFWLKTKIYDFYDFKCTSAAEIVGGLRSSCINISGLMPHLVCRPEMTVQMFGAFRIC